MKKTAVVILNYNGAEFLRKFLPGVILNSKDDADIWVADNCSTDESIELLKSEFPEVHLIVNEKNTGYAGGYNQALKKINYKYYILLNSDIEISEPWIKPMEELMESDSKIAACQPLIRSFYQKEKFEYAGAAGGFIDKFGYPFCRGRIFQSLENDENQYNDEIEVFWASGACMMIRSDLFHENNGFDEDFFAHMEEIDLCWRLKNNGFKIMFTPKSKVFHVGGGTLPKSSAKKTYLNFRNNFSLLYKNLTSEQLFWVFIVRLFLDGIAGIKFLIEGGFADTIAVIRAHFYFYKNLPNLKQKRKNLNHKKVSCLYQRNIVFQHYILKKNKFSSLNTKDFST